MNLLGWFRRLGDSSNSDFPSESKSKPGIAAPRSLKFAVLAIFWFVAVAGLTVAMVQYAGNPGEAERPQIIWPVNSLISPETDRATLVMFVHPHCPCTRASLEELSKLMTKCRSLVYGYVVLSVPTGLADDWADTDIKRMASQIHDISVVIDHNSRLTRDFACKTSGGTLLYDKNGNLVFQGGITQARGHEGDNAGRFAIQEILHGRVPEQKVTPVFGCGLLDSICVMGDVN